MSSRVIRVCIITAYESQSLKDSIEAILSQKSIVGIRFSILIIDISESFVNYGKTAGFGSIVDYRRSYIRNIALLKKFVIAEDGYDYTVFLSQDCIPGGDWLSLLYTSIAQQSAPLAYGPIRSGGFKSWVRAVDIGGTASCPAPLDNYIVSNAILRSIDYPVDDTAPLSGLDTAFLFNYLKLRQMPVAYCEGAVVSELIHGASLFIWIARRWYHMGNHMAITHSWCFGRLSSFFPLRSIVYLCGVIGYRFGYAGNFRLWGVWNKLLNTYPCEDIPINYSFTPNNRTITIDLCVVTYRRVVSLISLLKSLEGQYTGDLFKYSILVVGNEDDTETKEAVLKYAAGSTVNISYFSETAGNIATARNLCLDLSTAEYIAFIDDDEEPSRHWLYNLSNSLISFDVDCVGGSVFAKFPKPGTPFLRGMYKYMLSRYITGTARGAYPFSNNIIFRRDFIIEKNIRFKPYMSIIGGDDYFFICDAIAAGLKHRCCDEAFVYELIPLSRFSFAWLIQRFYRYGNGYSEYILCGKPGVFRLWLLFIYFLYFIKALFLAPWYLYLCMRDHNMVGYYCYTVIHFLGEIGTLVGLVRKEYKKS